MPHGCATLSRCLVLARPLAPLRIRAAAAANRRTAGPEAHLPLALPFRCASAYPARAARPEAPRSNPIFLVWIETPGRQDAGKGTDSRVWGDGENRESSEKSCVR